MERQVSGRIKKWLGIPRSLSAVALYSTSSKLQMPFQSLTEEFKLARTGTALTIHDSKDSCVRSAGVFQYSGRKWSANTAIQEAETRLQQEEIVGIVCRGRQGIGYQTTQLWSREGTRGRRVMIQKKVRQEEEENRIQRAVGMRRQGAWMNWTGVTERSVTCNDIWKASPYSLKFLMSSVYDLLPTPMNLQLWGKREDAACGLCGRRASLEHILSSCKTALTQGRYRWRHDQVLKELAQCLEEGMKKVKTTGVTTFIQFVRPSREATKAEKQHEHGFLASAGDWEMLVDLERQLRFPREIRSTELRPDIVIW